MKTLSDIIKFMEKIDELIEYQRDRVKCTRKAIEKSQWVKMQPELKPYYEKYADREEDILDALIDARFFYCLILEGTKEKHKKHRGSKREKEDENN